MNNKHNLELLRQFEDFTATQGLVNETGEGTASEAIYVIDQEDSPQEIIVDGEVQEDMVGIVEEFNQMASEQVTNQEGEVVTSLEEGVEEQNQFEDNTQVACLLEEMEVNQSEMCQVFLEDNLDQPGTFKVFFVQVAGEEEEVF